LYTEIKEQQAASLKFIEAKKASDYLLNIPVEAINDSRKRPIASQRIKRERAAAPPAPIVNSPLIKELDNIASLFHLINDQGKEIKWWGKLRKFNFLIISFKILAHRFMIQFGPATHGKFKDTFYQDTAIYDIIHHNDAMRHPVQVDDKVLALIDGHEKYAPAIVLEGYEGRANPDATKKGKFQKQFMEII
jgi:hypothetical protein